MDKLNNIDCFGASYDERHFIGNILDDDSGFCSSKSDDKASVDFNQGPILSDVKNNDYSLRFSSNNNGNFPSSPRVAIVSPWISPTPRYRAYDNNSPFYDEKQTDSDLFSPTTFYQNTKKIRSSPLNPNAPPFIPSAQKQKSQQFIEPPIPSLSSNRVVGFNPVKPRKDLLCRDVDFAKNSPRKKDRSNVGKQPNPNSDRFTEVKGPSFKSRSSPTTRSSSNENLVSSRRFDALKRLEDEPSSSDSLTFDNGSARSKSDVQLSDDSSVVSGSSNEGTGSRTSKRRVGRSSSKSHEVSGFSEFFMYIWVSFIVSDPSGKRKNKTRQIGTLHEIVFFALNFIIIAWNSSVKMTFWLVNLVVEFILMLLQAIRIMIRALIHRIC